MNQPDVRLVRNHPSGNVTAWWMDETGHLNHRQYVLFTDEAIEEDVREDLNAGSVEWEEA